MYIKNITIKFDITIYYISKENEEEKVQKHTCSSEPEMIDCINWLIKNQYPICKIETNIIY